MEQNLDEKDLKILDVLKEHSEYTTRQISKKTLLPITTVHNRIKKLRKTGIITNFTIKVDNSKLGKNFVVYLLISVDLALLKSKNKSQYDLATELKKFYFIEQADIVSGGTDIVAIVRVKDVSEFDRCLLTKIHKIDGIEKTQSLIVIHSV